MTATKKRKLAGDGKRMCIVVRSTTYLWLSDLAEREGSFGLALEHLESLYNQSKSLTIQSNQSE